MYMKTEKNNKKSWTTMRKSFTLHIYLMATILDIMKWYNNTKDMNTCLWRISNPDGETRHTFKKVKEESDKAIYKFLGSY